MHLSFRKVSVQITNCFSKIIVELGMMKHNLISTELIAPKGLPKCSHVVFYCLKTCIIK